jgi:two-component system phosphate regulon sensor histidine kinase PhoR
VILGQAGEPAGTIEVSRPLAFLFSDWKLMLGSRHTTAEEWAQSNFVLNLSLSGLLAVVLLGGVVLALRTASREMRLSQMKADFVSNVSHELRTPIASIRVFGEFLRLGRVRSDEKVREYGEYIETESRRLTHLIDNILDFSKIESGAKTYEFETLDLAEALADTLRSLAVRLRHDGFQLVVETGPGPLPRIRGDRDAIAQALANLVDNAVKYSGQSSEVVVRITPGIDEVVLSVRDGGIGISREEQAKIFERFHRVSTGLVHDVRGSGLGLAIVRHIALAHGGRVRVESELGRGSTFYVHLPAVSSIATEPPIDAPIGVVEREGRA